MVLDHVDQEEHHLAYKANASPFFMSSRALATSPQSWELQDVDFLLPGPVAANSRSHSSDSSRKYYFHGLHDSELSFSSELDDATKPLAFRSGAYWQDMALCEPATSEFSPYFIDDDFSTKISAVSRPPTSMLKLVPPTKLRVHATTCSEESSGTSRNRDVGYAMSKDVVSPTMVNKKILVTDNDLRIFSASSASLDNIRALTGHESTIGSSPHLKREKAKVAPKKVASVGQPSLPTMTSHLSTKRQASHELDYLDHETRALKRFKGSDQQAWCVPSFDPRWYYGLSGFHALHPRLSSPMKREDSSIYRSIQHQVRARLSLQQQKQKAVLQSQYSAPTRKIGIYPPAERRERLKRFHEKRKLRVYHKRIKYDCRKRLANSCPRIKGRFVRKSEFLQANEGVPVSPDSCESTSSTEDC